MQAATSEWGDIVIYILAGLVIGALARLIVPGRQRMGILATILVSVVAAVIGGSCGMRSSPTPRASAWIGAVIVD